MRNQLEIAYVAIEVPEPRALDSFFSDVIGLVQASGGDDHAVAWRNDDKAYRVVLERGVANDLVRVGFEAMCGEDFDATLTRLELAGFDIDHATATECTRAQVARLARVSAPWGVIVEVCEGLAHAETAFSAPLMPGGFLTDGLGFGHVVFATTEFDESHRFVTEGLGMTQSDWVDMTIANSIEIQVRFYHCNARHHSIALARAPFELPQKLHHVMFESRSRDDVGAAFDRAWNAGLGIPSGLGMHDNDRMFSFYVTSPAGFQIEVGHGARVIDDHWSDNRRYDRASRWGHQPLRIS